MTNVKVGDKVCQLYVGGDYVKVKFVKAINPQTISVCDCFEYQGRCVETGVEPKQSPDNWRIYVPEFYAKAEALSKEIRQKQKELRQIINDMPVVEVTK